MIRKIIKIDEDKCNGCGLCAEACHENAIAMVNNKAKLIRDDYCDGLGNCLPACPTGAISFEEREALPYDDAAVKARQEELRRAAEEADKKESMAEILQKMTPSAPQRKMPIGGCPGSMMRDIMKEREGIQQEVPVSAPVPQVPVAMQSELAQWPVQLKLIPVNAPSLRGAHLLVAADCTAFSCGDFHRRFMRKRVTLIGCPKLDEGDYADKLTAILTENNIKSLMIVRMEVPCCGGLENAVRRAIQASGKVIPWRVVVVTVDGRVLEEQEVL